jgi:hypothetical protein
LPTWWLLICISATRKGNLKWRYKNDSDNKGSIKTEKILDGLAMRRISGGQI